MTIFLGSKNSIFSVIVNLQIQLEIVQLLDYYYYYYY